MYVGKGGGKLEKEGKPGREARVDHGLVCHVDLDFVLLLTPHFHQNGVCVCVCVCPSIRLLWTAVLS